MQPRVLFLFAIASCGAKEAPAVGGAPRALASITQAELLEGAATHVPARFNPDVGDIHSRVSKVMFHPPQCEVPEGGVGIFRCPLAQQVASYQPGGLTEQVSKVAVEVNGVCFDLYSGQFSGTSFGPQVYPTNFENGDNFSREPYVYGPWDEHGVDRSGDPGSVRRDLTGVFWFLRVPTHCPPPGWQGASRPAWNGVLLQYMHHSGGLDVPPFLAYLGHFDEIDLLRRGFAYFSMSASNVSPRDTNPNNDLHLRLAFLSSDLCFQAPPLGPQTCDVDGDPRVVTTPGLPYAARAVVTGQPAGLFLDALIFRDTVRVVKNLLRAVTGQEAARTVALTRSASGGLSMVMSAAQAPRNLFYNCGARTICDDPTSPRVYDAFINMSPSFPIASFMRVDGSLTEPLGLPAVFYDGVQTANNNPTGLIFAREAHRAGVDPRGKVFHYGAIENLPHSPGDETLAGRYNAGRFAVTAAGVVNEAGAGRHLKWTAQNVFERAPLAIPMPALDLVIDVARQTAYHTALLSQVLDLLDHGTPMPRGNWDLYHASASVPAGIPEEDVAFPAPTLVPGPDGYASAMAFDGSIEQVQIRSHPDLQVAAGESFTVMLWVRTAQRMAPGEIAPLVGTHTKGAINVPGWRLFLGSDGRVVGRLQDAQGRRGARAGQLFSLAPINDDRWHHVAFVRRTGSGAQQQLYVDGALQDSQGDNTQDLTNPYSFTVGLQAYFHLAGAVDEVRFFPAAKTAAEVLAYAQAAGPPPIADEVLYLPLDEADDLRTPNRATAPAIVEALVNTHLCGDPDDEDKACAGAPEEKTVAGMPENPWDHQSKFPYAPLPCFNGGLRPTEACLCFRLADPSPCRAIVTRDVTTLTGPFKFYQRRAINHERLHRALDLEPATVRLPDDQARLGFYLLVGLGQGQRRFTVDELRDGVYTTDWTGLPIHFAGYGTYAGYRAALLRAITHEGAAGRYEEETGAVDVQGTCAPSGGFPVERLPRDVPHVEAGAQVAGALGKEVAVLSGAVVDAGAVIGDGGALAEGAAVAKLAEVGACVYLGPGARIDQGAAVGARAIVGREARVGRSSRLGDDCAVLAGALVDQAVAVGAGCRLGLGSRLGAGVTAGSRFFVGRGASVGAGATFGDRVTIGDGAVIGRSALVGTFVQIGPGATIPAGAVIPDGTVVH
jgi:carbonic anhydrase/acetyltransferase-like protein (isoleucine patch superfamily)